MRGILIAATVALGTGLLASSPTVAAPVHGMAIGNAANVGSVTEQAHWRYYRWRPHYRHHYYRRWW